MTEIKLSPMPPPFGIVNPDGREGFIQYGGMTLRDMMALSVSMPDDLSVNWATVLVGSAQPGVGANAIDQIDWWAQAEAAYRYRIADAMLKAREEA